MKPGEPYHTRPRLTLFLPSLLAAAGILLVAGTIDARTTGIALVMATLIGVLNWRHFSRVQSALATMTRGLHAFAEGRLDQRLPSPDLPGWDPVFEAFNRAARQLNEQMHVIHQQTREHEAILASMVEGVIALNSDGMILQVNKAAGEVLGISPELITGRSMYEMIRNHELQKIVEKSLQDNLPVEGEVQLQGANERSLQVHSTALRNPSGESIGALVVLNDITRLRRLERMRRDFVANVSHELKTPLTSIRGFVETLLDGTLEEPEEARRFCKIIAKQVDRLQNIIEDLLSLSRIEQHVDHGHIPLKDGKLLDVIQTAIQSIAHAAIERKATVNVSCDPSWTARINAPLFEQVIVNLIDNALKYSETGKTIDVRVACGDACWEISVVDQGYGIEQVHLDRIFERFYRVDKARSRKEGGTGLGLAIVKHIVVAHGGHLKVQSKPGAGSTFTVFLPR